MVTFVLILLLLAAAFGVLGLVLKAALVIILSILLSIAFLVAFGYYWLRWRVRQYQRDVERSHPSRRPLPPDARP